MSARFTERRKADREQMAQRVADLCAFYGAKCVVGSEFDGPRRISLGIELGEICVGLDFDGDNCSQLLDNYCLPWNTLPGSKARMTDRFAFAAGAEVNPFHRAKCTAFAAGIDALLLRLEAVFHLIKLGEAYTLPDERASA